MTSPRATTVRKRPAPKALRVEEENSDAFFATDGGIPDIEMPEMPKSKAETELILKSLAKTYALTAQFVMNGVPILKKVSG